MNFLSVLIILIKLESNPDKTLDVAHTKYSWRTVTSKSTQMLRIIWIMNIFTLSHSKKSPAAFAPGRQNSP